jgi:crotonobetainyl-CoA:carnitine CoA-transferase CaiB-like acyl-CoA transferase
MLGDLKVIEFGEFVSAPVCGKMLAEAGAEVIKVEKPGTGDLARSYGPFPEEKPHLERSGLYLSLNNNKLGITLDVKNPRGRDIFFKLLKKCDVLIEGYPPKEILSLGLDYQNTSEVNRSLIHCSITPFGQTGPYSDLPGTSLQCCALSGASWAIGSHDREPLEVPLHQSDFQAGINGACAIVVALIHRARQGKGQHIDVSASDVMAHYVGINALTFIYYGLKWHRDGRRAYGSGGPYPYGIFPCKDGQVCLIGRSRQDWDNILTTLGKPEWAENPRYRDLIKMGCEYPDEVDSLLIPLLKRYTQAELFEMAQRRGIPLAPLWNISQVLNEPHFAEREVFVRTNHPEAGDLLSVRLPYRLHQNQNYAFNLKAAPTIGQHNELVFCRRLGYSKEQLQEFKSQGII